MKNDYIYVVLVRALTGLGKFARMIGKYEYTHIAVCLDDSSDRFYTFSRRKHSSPFDCGFMAETLDCYAFGNHKSVKLKVFKLPVCEHKKREIKEYIERISKDPEYLFNFFSMLTMPLFHGFKIYKTHNCMSFVSKIIKLSGAARMSKPYYKYDIKELDKLLCKYLFEEKYYVKKKTHTKDYMSHVGITRNSVNLLKLSGRLIYRMVVKGNTDYE